MSKSLRKDNSAVLKCNISSSAAGVLHAEEPTVMKSGTFDAELDLLETTLSELKQDEIESSTGELSFQTLVEDNHNIKKSLSDTDSNLKSSGIVNSYNECHKDIFSNNLSCTHKHDIPKTQNFKSIRNEGSNLISERISVDNSKYSYMESDSDIAKYEVTNSCLTKDIAKPVSVLTSSRSNCDDETECGKQQCLSLENLEVINVSTNCSVSLGLGEQSSQKNNKSDQGCDFYIVTNNCHINQVDRLGGEKLELVTNGLCNREYSTSLAVTMEDAVSNVKNEVNKSNNTIGTVDNIVTDISTVDSEVSKIEHVLSVNKDIHGNKENRTVEEEFLNAYSHSHNNFTPGLETDIFTQKLKSDITLKLETDNVTDKLETHTVTSNLENNITPKKQYYEVTLKSDVQDCDELTKKQGIFSSTPNIDKNLPGGPINRPSVAPDFGLVSPLDAKILKGKNNLKRKCSGLPPIEETDEAADKIAEKKIKTEETTHLPEASTSTLPCYEAPAKSLLKMWQPSCLSRNVSASSYIVLDECGETESEDYSKLSQEHETPRADEFEIACQSLTEELWKSSSNIETLEKYHSQVQLENQIDDEKFDEILKELTMNVDLDEQTCLSLISMDESTLNETFKTCHVLSAVKESVDMVLSGTEDKSMLPIEGSLSSTNRTITEEANESLISDVLSLDKNKIDSFKKEVMIEKQEKSITNSVTSESKPVKDEPPDEEKDVDEEDVLLEGNNAKDRPYEFFEFVSSDPKENEDNYNPEWQKLGKLTSDEERYKAVRDRWRSLVPPDPNRNLTYRQWRSRNSKPPIALAPLNNNHQLMDDIEKNQLCTVVFDNKIGKIVKECEDSRMKIFRERNSEFERLARVQDEEQRKASMYHFSYQQLSQLHCHHLNQCRAVKVQYDQELKRINNITEDKIRILRDAKEEVMLFQKFYRGVGSRDESEMYMTDIQVQELMETEEMLEQYKAFYN